MCNQGLDQSMSVGHVCENHKEVVLRSTEQVGTEHNRQGLSSHLIVFFKVGNSVVTNRVSTNREEKRATHLSKCSDISFSKSKLARGRL